MMHSHHARIIEMIRHIIIKPGSLNWHCLTGSEHERTSNVSINTPYLITELKFALHIFIFLNNNFNNKPNDPTL